MTQTNKISFFRVIMLLLVLLLLGYLTPFFLNIHFSESGSVFSDDDGMYSAAVRSVLFAFFSSILNILLSLWIAIKLKNIHQYSFKGLLLSALIIPALLGDVSTSFIYKLLLSDITGLQQHSFQKLLVTAFIQFWQYGTLFVYIIWLVIKNIPIEKFDYCKVSYFSPYEIFRDLILPACRNTVILLFIISFIFSVYESSKLQLIFRSSRGTDSEFINQLLTRTYQSASLLNPVSAREEIYSTGFLFFVLLLGILLIVISGLLVIFNLAMKKRKQMPVLIHINGSSFLFYTLIVFLLAPVLFILVHVFSNFSISFSYLLYPLCLSLLAALVTMIIAIVTGAAMRIGWMKYMDSLNSKSQFAFYLILLLQLLPGIIITLLSYQWAAWVNLDKSNMGLLWIAGHILLILPLISCLLITTHFKVSNNEIHYLMAHKTSVRGFLKLSFLLRFKGDYLLTFLICVTMIWNDPLFNSILSDYVPSFISEMKMSITGRAADYSRGISYFAVSLMVALGAWSIWVYNHYKNRMVYETY